MDTEQSSINQDIPLGTPKIPFTAPYPNLKQAWTLFFLFLIFSLPIGLVTSVFSKIEAITDWVFLASYLGNFALIFFYIRYDMHIRRQQISIKIGNPPAVLFILLLFITPLISIITEPITAWIPMPKFMEEILNEMVSPNVASFLSVVIAAPLCEEIFCRGIILDGLLRNKVHPVHAIASSSLLFAALHLNPWQGVSAFIIGCLMGWMYYKTRSLLPCIFIHFTNNGLAFLLLCLIDEDVRNLQTWELVGQNYIWYYMGAIVACTLLIYAIYRYLKNKPQPSFDD